MKPSKQLLALTLSTCITTAWGQSAKREPHIGYLYPGGGRQGSVFEVTVGGQFLRGVTDVYVSGEGVRASVIQHYRPARNLQREQRQALIRRLKELRAKRLAELPAKVRAAIRPGKGLPGMRAGKAKDKKAEAVKLPDHPLLRNLESKSLRELHQVANEFFNRENFAKKQPNAQIAEVALIKVTIDPDAAPGDRELRLGTPLGLTNPMCFQVGQLPEIREQEPNDLRDYPNLPLPDEAPIDLPVLLNGQIMPGDIDRFRLRAKRGQRLVIQTHARHLVPFLADAVPGWFQATLALYDSEGREMAFADDYRFNPDPVLFYEIPKDGVYELEVRDSIYRGREDFVYRIGVGELPFITRAFPLGGRVGVKTVAAIGGWNLPKKRLRLDTQPGDDRIRHAALRQKNRLSNEVTYAVDTLPECNETEPNDDTKNAQRVSLPRIINGRISRPDDVDVFRFEGHAGDEVVAEVQARRLHSPLDSLLRLTDASGRVLELNDDYMRKDGHLHKDMGSITHHADSYLSARLLEDGAYCVHLTDTQNHGGEAYGYRLRISPPQPDFALRMTPASLSMPGGRVAPIAVHALRKDGFEGDIELALKDAPPGFVLSGGRVPGGCDRVRVTLTAPGKRPEKPVALKLVGRVRIDGKTISRTVVPSEDVMQAFLWRHLTPSRELLVAVTKTRWSPSFAVVGSVPVQIPAGGTAQVHVKTSWRPKNRKIELTLSEPVEGVILQNVKAVPDGLAFQLKVEGDAAKAGFAGNLIVEAITEYEIKRKGKKGGRATTQKRRAALGILPAIPFVVVEP